MNLSRNVRIVLLSGAPATGKTSLARFLRIAYGWPVFAKDDVKEILLDTLGPGDRDWSRRLSDASFEILFRLAEQRSGQESVLVLEGNFRSDRHGARLGELCGKLGADLLQVLLHAERAVLMQRIVDRAASVHRHPGHRDTDLLAEIERDPAYFALRPLPLGGQVLREDVTYLDDRLLTSIAGRVHAAVHQAGPACDSVAGSERRPRPPGAPG